jgi:hypothetical protein
LRIHKIYIIIGLILAFGLFFELAAHASVENEQTTITINAPVQVPGKVLPAGTYIFERADDNNPNIVRIFNADRTVVETTLQTVPADRIEPAEQTIVTLAKATSDNPDYLVKWFYPGNTTGHEFIYTRQQEQQIASAPQQTVTANQSNASMPSAVAAGQ